MMQDKRLEPILSLPWSVEWTEENADELAEFLNTETARRTLAILMTETFGSKDSGFINGVAFAVNKMRQLPWSPVIPFKPERFEIEEFYGKSEQTDSISQVKQIEE